MLAETNYGKSVLRKSVLRSGVYTFVLSDYAALSVLVVRVSWISPERSGDLIVIEGQSFRNTWTQRLQRCLGQRAKVDNAVLGPEAIFPY